MAPKASANRHCAATSLPSVSSGFDPPFALHGIAIGYRTMFSRPRTATAIYHYTRKDYRINSKTILVR